jgi:pyruvate dehydrogenase E2 component (dihydrolipoamide acetyltransferase)
MPKLGFDMAEGTLVRWIVGEGEQTSKGKILAEIETDKATVEVESAFDGIVARHLVSEGDVVPVNTPIAVIAAPGEQVDFTSLPGGDKSPAPAKPAPAAVSETVPPEPAVETMEADLGIPGGVKASPLARSMARELGIDLRAVRGTGPGGRITKNDIKNFAAAPPLPPAPESPVAPKLAPVPAVQAQLPIVESQTIPLNRLRAAIGRRMVEAKQQVPHFYVTHEFDMAAVMLLRQQVNSLLPDDGKTSVNDYILKAVALCLREYPNLNASLSGTGIIHHGHVNIGVAVAVEGGLLTVVCRDADQKSVRMIAAEVKAMVARAREGRVKPEDIEGSTFSVSNLGMFDVEHFIAIINPPEAAILAVGSVREIPVVSNGQVVPGMRMRATISVDHRVSDGAEAAQFLQAMAKYLEEPLRLMI